MIIPYENLAETVRIIRDEMPHYTFITVSGAFDLLHVGHLRRLQEAKEEGDILIVGVNSNESITATKGSNRPIIDEYDRAEMVNALACVDYVTIFPEPTSWAFVNTVKPIYHIAGLEHFVAQPAPVLQLPRIGKVSTSQIIETILERYPRRNEECRCGVRLRCFVCDPLPGYE